MGEKINGGNLRKGGKKEAGEEKGVNKSEYGRGGRTGCKTFPLQPPTEAEQKQVFQRRLAVPKCPLAAACVALRLLGIQASGSPAIC